MESLKPLNVLYEDNHIIAVEKPAGMLVQGDTTGGRSGETSLLEEVRAYIKVKYSKQGNVFLGLVHRLDRNVGGIVVFAKTSKGASRLSEQFRVHSVEKTYHAWVHGIPRQASATLVHYLSHNEATNTARVHDEEIAGSSRAQLAYDTVRTEGDFSLLKVRLMTGRHHQIRAQLTHIGHPIVGDVKYGSTKAYADKKILLKATGLSFDRATSETASDGTSKTQRIRLTLPIPEIS